MPTAAPFPPFAVEAASAARVACLHCGADVPAGYEEPYCCAGCRLVHLLIERDGLGRYYDLRGPQGQPAATASLARDTAWLEPFEARLAAAGGPVRFDLELQGVHCAGCVWLVEELFRKHAGGLLCVVNPALGTVQLVVAKGFELREFVAHVSAFGYLLGAPSAEPRGASPSGLVVRMGLAIAIAMNAMIFSIPIYFGLGEGPVYRFFGAIGLGLATLAVVVGAPVFVVPSWHALRRGVAHIDMPISLGIGSAYASSLVSYFAHGASATYFDTLDVFIALMLVGRWLQERVLERNRRLLLGNDGVDGLRARRIEGDRVATIACADIAVGDRLVLAPGDLVPVASTLDADVAAFSLDWINGESEPLEHARGDHVVAGAFLAGTRSATVVAREPFAASMLVDLLRSPPAREADAARATPFWRRFAAAWVLGVLAAATLGAATAYLRTRDAGATLDVVTAVLILTCPCAFGIATPLAYELVQAGLRRAGLFVRTPGFLDRALDVTDVVFDKTGTVTTGRLRLVDAAPLASLSALERTALFNLVARSTHPKSVAVRAALESSDATLVDAVVEEQRGEGLTMRWHGRTWRVGATAAASANGADVAFSVDGEPLCQLATAEEMRHDAAAEIAALRAAGYAVHLLTGDTEERARTVAGAAGIASDAVVAGESPDGKAAWLGAHAPERTLMVGDGINDGPAVDVARCSGTPAIDRPFMAARSDFYFVTPGLRPVRLALAASRALARVTRRNLAFAVAYNVIAVGLAVAGLMTPVLSAVLMPASSVSILLATVASLSERSPLWRS